MTTKDYKLIASVLREAAAKEGYEISTLVEMFAGALQKANPNFDSERFARAVWAPPREPASRTGGRLAQQFTSSEAHNGHSLHDGFCYSCQTWLYPTGHLSHDR